MNKKMLDVLACPIDKNFPLALVECISKGNKITEGVLLCSKCSRFFPIIEEIPIMLPDDLRDKNMEMKFLEKNKTKLANTLKKTKPWHL